MINEKPQVINEYEAGKAIPNPQVGGHRWLCMGLCTWLESGPSCCRTAPVLVVSLHAGSVSCLDTAIPTASTSNHPSLPSYTDFRKAVACPRGDPAEKSWQEVDDQIDTMQCFAIHSVGACSGGPWHPKIQASRMLQFNL